MPAIAHRLVIAIAFACGMAMLLQALLAPGETAGMRQLLFIHAVVGGLLAASVFVPGLRIPGAVAGAVLQGSALPAWGLGVAGAVFPWADLLQAVLLGLAAAAWLAEARREARWDAVLPLRQEQH